MGTDRHRHHPRITSKLGQPPTVELGDWSPCVLHGISPRMSDERRYQAEVLVMLFGPSASVGMVTWFKDGRINWALCLGALGCSLVVVLMAMIVRRKSRRCICPQCNADVELDFMAPCIPGSHAVCKACSGDARRYPWLTRRLWKRSQRIDGPLTKPNDVVVEKRMCSKCLRIKYKPFLVEVPNVDGYRKFECLPRDRKSCDRRAKSVSTPFEDRPWHVRQLRLMRLIRSGLERQPPNK